MLHACGFDREIGIPSSIFRHIINAVVEIPVSLPVIFSFTVHPAYLAHPGFFAALPYTEQSAQKVTKGKGCEKRNPMKSNSSTLDMVQITRQLFG